MSDRPDMEALGGTAVESGGNRPLVLNDPEAAYVIDSGEVDVFFVRHDPGGQTGPRCHLLRAGPGGVLLGAPATIGDGVLLIGVGLPGSRIFRVPSRNLLEAAYVEGQTGLAGSLAEWMAGLVQGAVERPGGMGRRRFLDVSGTTEVETGEALTGPDPVAWIRSEGAGLNLMDRPDLGRLGEDGWFPLPFGEIWLGVEEGGRIVLSDTAGLGDLDEIGTALNRFQARVLEMLGRRAEEIEARLTDRLSRKQDADRRFLEEASARLAGVSAKATLSPTGPDRESEMAAACRVLGRTQGFRIIPPPLNALERGEDPLSALARASGFRYRKVALPEGWRREDLGPLLGFVADDMRPVALIPTRQGRYMMTDPSVGRTIRVGRREAEALSDEAYVLYRPLPEAGAAGRDLWGLGLFGRGRDIALIVAAGLAAALLGLAAPIATGIVFDRIIPEAAGEWLWEIAGLLSAAALAAGMFELTRNLAAARIEGHLDAALGAAVWDRLLAQPAVFFRRYSVGDLTARAMALDEVRQTVSGLTVDAALSALFSVAFVGLLFYYDAGLALWALGLTALGLIVVTVLGLARMRIMTREYGAEGRTAARTLEFVAGAAKLRAAGAEDRAFSLWARRFARQKRLSYRSRSVEDLVITFNACFPVLTMMLVFGWVAAAGQGRMSTGEFLAFSAAFIAFQNAWLRMVLAVTSALGAAPLYERARVIFQAGPEVDAGKTPPGQIKGGLEVRQAAFRYHTDGPLVLKGVNLYAEAGEFVAVVGASGSGKSTIFRLLLGFEEPESGGVYYDGQDLSALDVREVRRQLGVVLQNSDLIEGNIFENIAGHSDLTLEEAWEAARTARIAEDIEEMPMGMHTLVTPGGGSLSGGQRQRILIARAVAHKPRILFFDESTSALDNQTQAEIHRALAEMRATRVVIAHRLSTIRDADRIYVIHEGRIVQEGRFAELVDQGGYFTDLARRQML